MMGHVRRRKQEGIMGEKDEQVPASVMAERLHLLAEGQALRKRLRELEQGHREVMEPRYYFLWRLLGIQQETVERGEAPDWAAIQPATSALIEFCGVESRMVCELYKTVAAYIAVAEMALQVTDLVEKRALSPRAVADAPLLH